LNKKVDALLCYNFTMKYLIIVLFALFIFLPQQLNAEGPTPSEERADAVVIGIQEEGDIIEPTGNKHPYQKLDILITSGKLKGKAYQVENGSQDRISVSRYKPADKVIVTITSISGQDRVVISDYQRRNPLLLLIGVFVVLTILIGGRRGFLSLIGMGITFVVLFTFVLPQIYAGTSPILVTFIASLIVIPITFVLAHGLNSKTACAVFGTFIALGISGVLAHLFINASHLSGFVAEEAGFLNTIKQGSVDIRGLLFAGIIIALLGILEDITISQSAIVFQLKKANSKLSSWELFARAMDIGKDHIASMANTLILVYAGASLPLLLLFVDSSLPFSQLINFEIIAEEIVRTMVASIGLILAVPITTAIAALYIEHRLIFTRKIS